MPQLNATNTASLCFRGSSTLILRFPNITTVYDFQVEDGTAYIVMEYVPDSLDKHIRAGQPLPHQRAVQVACTGGRPAGAAVDVRDGRQVHVLSSSTG